MFLSHPRPILAAFFSAWLAVGPAGAQTSQTSANQMFSEAMALFQSSQTQDVAAKKKAASQIVEILDRITESFPQSLPGQRIAAGGKIGPMDIDALRALAAVQKAESLLKEAVESVEAQGSEDTQTAEEDSETADVAEPLPEPEPEPLAWFERVIKSGNVEGTLGHAAFPSVGQRTHPGVDIAADCGAAVTAPWGGTVTSVVAAENPLFPVTGKSVALAHDTEKGFAPFSVVFGMEDISVAAGDTLEKGQAIGTAGRLHGADDCGVHFEARFNSFESAPFLKYWNAPLGVGDWRQDRDFLTFYPETKRLLARLLAVENGDMVDQPLLASLRHVNIRPVGIVGQFQKTSVLHFSGVKHDHGLSFQGRMFVSRDQQSLATQVHLTRATLSTTGGASAFRSSETRSFVPVISIFPNGDTDAKPMRIKPEDFSGKITLRNGIIPTKQRTISFSIPPEAILADNTMQLQLLDDKGNAFDVGKGLQFKSTVADTGPDEAAILDAKQLAARIHSCVKWAESDQARLTLTVEVDKKGRVKQSNPNWVAFEAMSKYRATSLAKSFTKQARECKEIQYVGYTSSEAGWRKFEVTFGGEN